MAELFYRKLMSVVDDYGRFDGRVKILKVSCYPMRVEDVSDEELSSWIAECCQVGLISRYEVDGKPYILIENFGQRLRIMRSKYPEPQDINNVQSYDSNLPQSAVICQQPADNLRTSVSNPPQPADICRPESDLDSDLDLDSESDSERDLDAHTREQPSHSAKLKKLVSKDWIKISEDHTGRANNQPRGKPPRDFRPKERNGKPLLEDHEALAILMNDQAQCELFMMNSHVRDPGHLKEVAEKWILYERKRRDEDIAMMTIQEARNGLHLWIKNEKPKSNGSSANKSAAGSENGFDILSERIAKELERIS